VIELVEQRKHTNEVKLCIYDILLKKFANFEDYMKTTNILNKCFHKQKNHNLK